jgi:hypothetical protein
VESGVCVGEGEDDRHVLNKLGRSDSPVSDELSFCEGPASDSKSKNGRAHDKGGEHKDGEGMDAVSKSGIISGSEISSSELYGNGPYIG